MKICIGPSLSACLLLLAGVPGLSAQAYLLPRAQALPFAATLDAPWPSRTVPVNAPAAPIVMSNPLAQSVQSGSAVVSLKEVVNAGSLPAQYWVCAGTSEAAMKPTGAKSGKLRGVAIVTANVAGLKPNTTYYLRFYASNDAGTGAGKLHEVKTGVPGPDTEPTPVATTVAAQPLP
jgi:hypothetical protein